MLCYRQLQEWVDNIVIPEESDKDAADKMKAAQNSIAGADEKGMKCKCQKQDCKCKKRCSCRMKATRRRLLGMLTAGKPVTDNPFRCNCDFQKGDLDFSQGSQMDCKCDKAACTCERKCMCEDVGEGSGSEVQPPAAGQLDAEVQ